MNKRNIEEEYIQLFKDIRTKYGYTMDIHGGNMFIAGKTVNGNNIVPDRKNYIEILDIFINFKNSLELIKDKEGSKIYKINVIPFLREGNTSFINIELYKMNFYYEK